MVCAFFGNRYITEDIEEILRDKIREMITVYGVDIFYVGTHGKFDFFVRNALKEMSKEFECIKYYTVLSRVPTRDNGYENPILPDGIEMAPARAGIVFRNNWMLKKADYVVAYVKYRGASESAHLIELADKQGKIVFNLYDYFS